MLLLGYDIGSSSVKGAILDGETGRCLASAQYPPHELAIDAPAPGWAEQHPDTWWDCLTEVTRALLASGAAAPDAIGAIGISYQMHGLVVTDESGSPLRPSIIWCDSRAVAIGAQAFEALGSAYCLGHLLNSPGNFTASKLRWVREQEPEIYRRIRYFMLPGDYLAFRLSGTAATTLSGLSEGICWDFAENRPARALLDYYGISPELIPPLVPVFGEQGRLSGPAARTLGLPEGIPITYRAGDQPNNALSLQVLQPGEVAATAGTSGVVYGVSGEVRFDPQSRVNSFAHVNHGPETRIGILLCVNGSGILNSWMRRHAGAGLSYADMNALAAQAPAGAEGLRILPFGNGAERLLGNLDPGCRILGLDFNRHSRSHLFRAAQEGIVFAFQYGLEAMADTGLRPGVIRAGMANLFLSPLFREALAALSGVPIELFNTDGAQGAARGAGIGAGYYASPAEAFAGLACTARIEPDASLSGPYRDAYAHWSQLLAHTLRERHGIGEVSMNP
ncbi:MAG: FGGY family carbohydrate kinase [Bacteroidia bacterium]|nr:FGGY family carbohydrate kinase [Bacteroidia bacterium]